MIGLQNATSIKAVTVATKELSNEELEAILVKTRLNQKQLEQILLSRNYSQAQAEVTAKTILATRANQAAEHATSGLALAFKGLFNTIKAHPIIAIIAALVALISTVVTLNSRIEEAKTEWNNNAIEKGKTLTDETSQLQTLIEKYRTLASSGKKDSETREEIKTIQSEINSLVGTQADNLDLVNGKLETQNKKLNNLLKTYADMPTLEAAYDSAREETIKQRAIRGGGRATGDDLSVSFGSNFKEKQAELEKIIENEWNKNGKIGHFERDTVGITVDFDIDDNNFRRRIEFYQNVLEELRKSDVFGSDSQTFKDILKEKQELEGAYKKQVEAAQNDVKGLITNSRDTTEEGNVKSLESYLNYRQKLIDTVKNDDKIKDMMKEEVFNEDDLNQLIDNYLSGLTGFSTYYQEWFDKFGSETAQKAAKIKEKLSTDMYFFNPEEQFNGGQEEINKWFDELTSEDKELLVKIDADTDTADWKLSDWQKKLEEYKAKTKETVDETNNLFAELMTQTGTAKDPSFVESIEKSIEKLQKLQDALTKVESGTLKDSERMSLFKTFPQLTAYANNLSEGIKHVTESMRGDIVEKFSDQFSKFKEQGASADEIAQLEAYQKTVLGIADAVVTTQNALSSMQTVFQDLDKIVKDYNENQYFSLESLEKLSSSSGQKYLQYLTYENGQLKVNEEAYKKLVLAQIDEIETKATLQATTDLESLSSETAAKEYLAKANIELADSQLSAAQAAFQYALALKLAEGGNVAKAAQKVADNLNTLRNIFASAREQAKSYSGAMLGAATATDKKAKASEKAKDALEKEKTALEHSKEALEQEKKALEKNKSEYEKAKNAIQSLIEWTQKYIKQIKENEIKALEEQKKKFDEVIEKRKEQLQAEKDLHEYEKSLSEKQNTLASNTLKAAIASLDDSAAGKKAYKKAQEEYKTSQTDLQDFLYEHGIEVREQALDKLKEDTDKSYQDQIDKIQEFLNDEVKMYREACSMIDNDNGTLYGKLLEYCLNYTTTGRAEFDHMWTEAKSAMDRYNTANLSTIDLINDLQGRIYDVDSAIDTLTTNIETYENRISNLKNQIDDLKDAAIEAKNAIDAANSAPLNPDPTNGKTSFWVKYNGKKYETGYNYNGDTEANRLLAASELTKIIAKDVGGFDNYGLSIVQGLLGVGGNKTGHHWTYTFQGKTYESRAASRDNAIADILSQISKKFGGVYPASASTIYGTIKGYAEGTKSATGGLHIVDEEGLFSEFIPYQIGKGRYSFLPEGNPVFSKAMTNTLFDFAKDPSEFANSIRNNSSKSNVSTSMVINIQGNADRETVKQLREFEKRYSNERLMKMSLNNKRII